MADMEILLRDILKDIAEEHEYIDSEITLKPIFTEGANYTSKLFAITLCCPGKNDLHLFSKVACLNEQSLMSSSVFKIEINFYTKILPKYKELEEIHEIPLEERLISPQYYGGSAENRKELLVFEDLSLQGYQSMDRFECFNWEYAAKSLSVIARFHALSVAFEKSDPVTYSSLVDRLKFDYPVTKTYLERGVLNAIKATDEKYRSRVEKCLQSDLAEQAFFKFSHPKRCLFLCHGDFRPSNILHKVDADGSLKLVLLDYQIIRRWNPVAELMFFLICGSDEQFRADHLEQFFDHYYEMFSAALQRFRIDPLEVYPEQDYRDDVKQMLRIGLTLGMYCLPFITVDTDKAAKPEDRIVLEDYDIPVGTRFSDRFNGLVRTYIQLGIL